MIDWFKRKNSQQRMVWILPFLAIALWFWGPTLVTRFWIAQAVTSNNYYAVYLDNNQTLYGHLRSVGLETIKMTDVYYLQSVQVGDQATTNLVKRGSSEISQPENFIYIDRDHVVYWEQVGVNSQVMQVIKQNK